MTRAGRGPATGADRPGVDRCVDDAGAVEPAETAETAAGPAQPSDRPPARRLALADPTATTAAEDLPEGWGDRGESAADRLARYRSERPPHHGG